MADIKDFNKDGTSVDSVFKETSPKLYVKKSRYQAFRSDEEDSSEIDEIDTGSKSRRKIKKEKTNSFKVKIKKSKGKKKDKDKEKKKKVKKSYDDGQGEYNDEPIFGVPLEVATERSGLRDQIPLPRIVRECIIYVEEAGLDDEGIYRLSGVKSKVDHLKQLYNEGRPVNLHEYDATTVASLLKLYLRELPSNVLTTRLAPIFDSCVSIEDPMEQMLRCQQLINDLPCTNRTLLGWLFVHFQHVMERTTETKMNIQNLSIVFSPTMSISYGVLNIFFTYTKDLFPDIKIVKYEARKEPSDEKELLMPDTIEDLQQHLFQNEEVLTGLHDRVNQDESEDESLMDELWERQRWSTQIKRKIKTIQKAEKEKEKSTDTLDEIDSKIPTSEMSIQEEIVNGNQLSDEHIKDDDVFVNAENENMVTEKSVSLEDVSIMVTNLDDETHWKTEVVASEEAVKENNFANFNEEDGEGFANFTETADKDNNFADFSSTNEFNDGVKENTPVEKSSADVAVDDDDDDDDDEECNTLMWEEKKLIIENEELQALTDFLNRKIEIERLEIERLKDTLREHQDAKDDDSSSSTCSSSRRSSIETDSNSSESEESNTELELIANELEEENKKLEAQGRELIENICSGRRSCAMLRTDIRFLQMMRVPVT